jgi:hypothetical protein
MMYLLDVLVSASAPSMLMIRLRASFKITTNQVPGPGLRATLDRTGRGSRRAAPEPSSRVGMTPVCQPLELELYRQLHLHMY